MPFCSHKCLLGLTRGLLMDAECPNQDIHPQKDGSPTGMHTLDLKSMQALLRDQLAESMDVDCTPMRRQGARGAMFKLTLTSHGYTFVGKGTVEAFIPDLRLEGQTYETLRCVQGTIIPVYLGNIDCVRPYYYRFATRIIHFLLLSWAGEPITEDLKARCETLPDQIDRIHEQLLSIGVLHNDVRPSNILWNQRLQQLMFIDFERSRRIPLTKRKLLEIAPTPIRERSKGWRG